MRLEIGKAKRPAVGQSVCGDELVVVDEQPALVGIADGLGHGPKAEEAAKAFCGYVVEHSGDSLESLIMEAGRTLRGTRGVVAALLRIDPSSGQAQFAGVGNIEIRALTQIPFHPLSTPGIIGQPLRRLQTFTHNLRAGDLFLLHSDGISSRFRMEDYEGLGSQALAEKLVETQAKGHDDATCLVVRC